MFSIALMKFFRSFEDMFFYQPSGRLQFFHSSVFIFKWWNYHENSGTATVSSNLTTFSWLATSCHCNLSPSFSHFQTLVKSGSLLCSNNMVPLIYFFPFDLLVMHNSLTYSDIFLHFQFDSFLFLTSCILNLSWP